MLFKYEQTLIRKEMKRIIKFGIPENERLLFSIPNWLEERPNKDFKRIHKGEFRYKVEMYDILYAKKRCRHNALYTNTCPQRDQFIRKVR